MIFTGQRKTEPAKPVRKQAKDRTGIPEPLKRNFEHMSGLSFDDVRVHYHSAQPARFDALAYTQGRHVYLGPGQEKHLPHELGHVVQQKTMNVPGTFRMEGTPVNDDVRLERGADRLAAAALGFRGGPRSGTPSGR